MDPCNKVAVAVESGSDLMSRQNTNTVEDMRASKDSLRAQSEMMRLAFAGSPARMSQI